MKLMNLQFVKNTKHTDIYFLGLWNCVYLIQQFVYKALRDVCLMRCIRMSKSVAQW